MIVLWLHIDFDILIKTCIFTTWNYTENWNSLTEVLKLISSLCKHTEDATLTHLLIIFKIFQKKIATTITFLFIPP